MLQTTGLTRTQDLIRLRDEWRDLADRCPDATVFQTHEWLAPWWEHFGRRPGNRLLLVTVRDPQGRLIGLAPLMTTFWHATPLRRLTMLGQGVSDYHDVLALPDQEAEVCAAVYAFLRGAFWQVGDFPQLREGGVLRRNPPSAGTGLVCRDLPGEPCPYLCLPQDGAGDSWNHFLGRTSKKFRGNIRYYDRALDKAYAVERRTVTDERDLNDALAALFDLHQRRWNERWLPGVLGGSRVRRFHRTVARAFLDRDWLRLHTLTLDGEVVAALYCIAYKGRTMYYQGGFEPTLAKLSLGTVVTSHAIRRALDESRQEFDFLRGDEPYKKRWTGSAMRRNHRRVIGRMGSPFFWLAVASASAELAVELRLKDWMHHGASSERGAGGGTPPEKEDGDRDRS